MFWQEHSSNTIQCVLLGIEPMFAADLTSVALMACGIGTFFHVVRFKIPFTRYYYGTGIVSVLGITTTQIVVGLNSISDLMVGDFDLVNLRCICLLLWCKLPASDGLASVVGHCIHVSVPLPLHSGQDC